MVYAGEDRRLGSEHHRFDIRSQHCLRDGRDGGVISVCHVIFFPFDCENLLILGQLLDIP